MVIPASNDMKETIVEFLKDKKTHTLEETKDHIIKKFKISDQDKKKRYERRNRSVLDTKIVQVLSTLRKQGMIENKERGIFVMSNKKSN